MAAQEGAVMCSGVLLPFAVWAFHMNRNGILAYKSLCFLGGVFIFKR